jgi:hypothetical protein
MNLGFFRSSRFHTYSLLAALLVGGPLTILFPDSLWWIAFMSWWAWVKTDWASMQAARAEESINGKHS